MYNFVETTRPSAPDRPELFLGPRGPLGVQPSLRSFVRSFVRTCEPKISTNGFTINHYIIIPSLGGHGHDGHGHGGHGHGGNGHDGRGHGHDGRRQ